MERHLLDNLEQETLRNAVTYELHLDFAVYPLKNAQISKKTNPVNRPTTRGGVYFSDYSSYRLVGTIEDPSILPLLSKTMLGPNTEFSELKIVAKTNNKKLPSEIALFSYLTNTMQSSSKIELNMTIARIVIIST